MNKVNENKIKELIEELKNIKSFKDSKRKPNFWYNKKKDILNYTDKISTDLIKEFLDEYNRVKKSGTKVEEIDTDDRAITNIERDEDGNIVYYTFEIFKKDRPTFRGKLDCREMEIIYNLYSTYGANLTAKIVSREFPQYSFVDFKRILRAFNIYKYDLAPQHILENLTEEELIERQNRIKENNVLRRLEKDQLSEANKLINKLAQENQKLSKSSRLIEDLVKYNPNFINHKLDPICEHNDNTLIIWLSDLHIGGYNEKYGFYDLPEYNKEEICRRLFIVANNFINQEYDNLIVVDLGDSIDQYQKETTRGGHLLPNNMTDKEMSHLYLDCMMFFFNLLTNKVKSSKQYYYSIGESNHAGDFGWALNLVLSEKLQKLGWNTYVSDYPIDDFTVGDNIFCYLHGKNNETQSKQFPLTLNPQTELYFANYIAEKKLNSNGNKKVYIVKGDLHQYAYTSGKQFDYISVGSMYATSQYIAANFGNTPWSINYTIVNKNIQFGKITD